MATTWAQAAAQVDRHYALIDMFDESVREAIDNLVAATDGGGPVMQANGSDPTEHTNDQCEAKQQSCERGDAFAE